MGVLDGIRIVEMDAIGPVPFAAMLLADMGADIVRIARASSNPVAEMGNSILHRSRSSLTLDLKADEGRASALELISHADAVIEGFRPGVMERLGLGPDVCLAGNPALVFGRMTGWGQEGPRAKEAGHDINYISLAGALSMFGTPGKPPEAPLNLVGDYAGGAMYLVMGVLAALLRAQKTGKGQVVDAAMTDGTASLLSLFIALKQSGDWGEARQANLLDGGAPFYRCYECADGGFVSVGALEPQFFAALLSGLEIPHDRYGQNDRATWPAMQKEFEALFASRSRAEWEAVFGGTDACVAPILTTTEAASDPHNSIRGTYVNFDGITQPAPAPRFSATPSQIVAASTESVETLLKRWQVPR